MALQFFCIQVLYPKANDFVPTETVVGTYIYEHGSGRNTGQTFVGTHRIFCAADFLNAGYPCEYSYLRGKTVTVKVAPYPVLFGTGEVVTNMKTLDGLTLIDLSRGHLVDQWVT